jgi:polysaccharide biosynthesis/export protein
MTIGTHTRAVRKLAGMAAGLGLALGGLVGLTGCETDSFLDPSQLGRFEMTPTVMPILDRLSSIEDVPEDTVQSEAIQPQDLIPEVEQYRFGAGDTVEVVIRDFITPGAEEKFTQVVDSRGYIFIPKLSPIRAVGLTNTELADVVRAAIRDAGIRNDLNAVVTLNVLSQRSQTFSVLGAVTSQQEYFIPKPAYRLLDALSTAQGFNENIDKIYVIRQVALSDAAAGRVPAPADGGVPTQPAPDAAPSQPRPPADLLDILDRMEKPKETKPSPGMWGQGGQPENGAKPGTAAAPPPIDLPDSSTTPAPVAPAPSGKSDWVYQNGQWVKTSGLAPAAPAAAAQPVVSQRVIEVPVARLLAGDASVNIVIRPGDVIRVPGPKTGVVYLAGQVARPGPYTLGGDTKLTLLRALDSGGGLSSIAIPERTDLTRIVGPGRQATIRLNLRAIAEQTQPDIYLKPDDRINIGTNFWALPLAIIRNGFRASYGFGFILDRNFQGEVFGADRSQVRN